MTDSDLVIIGAGPAGMAAAATAAASGLSVTIVDEQPAAGGQIYRAIETAPAERCRILGEDYLAGRPLAAGLADDRITHATGATVWRVEVDGTVVYSRDGVATKITGKCVLVATGALERPVPIPGWTLPGVMLAGAAQILLKQSGVVPSRAVITGAGPLVYLVAQQLIRAGHPPLALVETQTAADLIGALPLLPSALRKWRMLAKGSAMLRDIRKAGVKRFTGARDLAVVGDGEAQALTFASGGRREEIACDTVLLHQGVVANTQITRALGLEHVWDDGQRAFRPKTDIWGATAQDAIFVAGDGAGVGGAKAAEYAGRLAALRISESLGAITAGERDDQAAPIRRALATERAFRPFIEAAYPPSREILRPADDAIICRCEEVTAGDIRRYAQLGCEGLNQTKAFGRPGMGPCQGRYCGLTVCELLAQAHGKKPSEIGYYRLRAPLKPVTLGELASLAGAPGRNSIKEKERT